MCSSNGAYRNVIHPLLAVWWCVATAASLEMDCFVSWVMIMETHGDTELNWRAFPTTSAKATLTLNQMSVRYEDDNFSQFCFSNICGCVTEICIRRVCKIFRLLSCVSSKPVELDDGSIVINVRNNKHYHCRCRMVVRSLDGGESLPVEELVFDHTLEDPAVAAGALEKEGVLYFTNPANTNSSEHDDISVSPSWSWSTTVLHLMELSLLTHLIRETSKMCSAVVLWEKDLLTNYF